MFLKGVDERFLSEDEHLKADNYKVVAVKVFCKRPEKRRFFRILQVSGLKFDNDLLWREFLILPTLS